MGLKVGYFRMLGASFAYQDPILNVLTMYSMRGTSRLIPSMWSTTEAGNLQIRFYIVGL